MNIEKLSAFVASEPSLIFLYVLQGSSNIKDLGLHENDDLCGGLDMDDVALNFENDEIFSCSQGHPEYQVQKALDCFEMEENLRATKSEGSVENTLEVFSRYFLPIFLL